MSIHINFKVTSTQAVGELRSYVCKLQPSGENPLPEFNALLDKVAEEAFVEGMAFAKLYPNLNMY